MVTIENIPFKTSLKKVFFLDNFEIRGAQTGSARDYVTKYPSQSS